MSPEQIEKARAHADHLLRQVLGLRETYAMLQPLAFDADLAKRVGKGPQAKGHLILKNTLLESCVQGLSKLAYDKSERAPSIINIMKALENAELRAALRRDYSAWVVPDPPDTDSEMAAALQRMRVNREKERGEEFDARWSDLSKLWGRLREDGALMAFKTWRDKVIAHIDLEYDSGTYSLLDIGELGLEWGDVDRLLGELQDVVDSINILARGAHFAFDMSDEQNQEVVERFWGLLG